MGTAVKPVRVTQLIPVAVTVEKGIVKVRPNPVTLSISKQHEAMWCCDQGELEIRFFPKNTPFRGHHFQAPKSGACCSGLPIVKPNENKRYKYTVIATIGGRAHAKDPDVIVKR